MFAHGMKESNQEVIELKDETISADICYPCLLIDIFLAFCLITVLQLHRVFNECMANSTLSSISVLVAMIWSVYDITNCSVLNM